MDEDVVANIRARIERCRRLAASTTDREVAAILLQMAQEGDADLERLATGDAPDGSGSPAGAAEPE
jgi:hypothetical protein